MWFLILCAISVLNPVHTAKILGIFHVSARSHYILGSSLMRALAERGHDVTVISPFGEKDPPKNYRDIILTGFVEDHERMMKKMDFFERRDVNPLVMLPILAAMVNEFTEKTLDHPEVKKLIESDEKFDLVVEEEFLNHAHKAFATHFQASLVVLSTLGPSAWLNDLVGNPTPLAYAPDVILGYSKNMTFLQRLKNSGWYLFQQAILHLYIIPQQQHLINKYFPNGPKIKEVMYNVSLVLLNSHFSMHQPVPYVPQMVDIGGFHVKPSKNLPKDLLNYLDNSKNGVIYFSLGSHLKSSSMPLEKREALVQTFSQLKEDVLWKYEDFHLPNKPSNVRIEKWLPQQDILAHPNVKLFITHGGLLSTIEIIYHGMPALAIPLAVDQYLNAEQIKNLGLGLKLPFHDITPDALRAKIDLLLTDPTYRKNAKKSSALFHDRLVKPMDTAIYWVEYVLRHGGTPHLRVKGLELPWYENFLLDVIALVIATGLVVVLVFCKIVECLCRLRKQKKEKQN